MKEVDAKRLIFLDECGSNIALTPLYARAPKGQRAQGSVPRNRGKNTTLLASLSLVTLLVKKSIELNAAFKQAAESDHWQSILEYTEEAIVSSDVIGNSHSCIIDGLSTMAHGKQVKVIGWYDNEWGYSCRLVDLVNKIAA